MKKIFVFTLAVAALGMASCSGTSDKAAVATQETTPTEKTVTVAPVATDGKVIELEDAAQLAPGVKVEQLTVVDFNAVWCGPCRQLTPIVEQLAEKYAGKVTFISVDVDKMGELMDQYNLGTSIPVVLFLKPDGTKVSYVGTTDLVPAENFEAVVEKYL